MVNGLFVSRTTFEMLETELNLWKQARLSIFYITGSSPSPKIVVLIALKEIIKTVTLSSVLLSIEFLII